jgi:lipoprotein-anchoring transpeptidase ErfK/SrfK
LTAVPGLPLVLRRASAVLLVLSVGVTAACVGERPTLATETQPTAPTDGATTSTAPTRPARVAQAKTESIDVYDDADGTTPSGSITTEEATAAPDIPIVFLVKDEEGGRLEVYLPTSPSGSTAWVSASDVTVSSVTFRIEVSLSTHRVRVFDGDEAVLDEPASIGRSERPEPGVVYYLKELLQPPDPDGPYGSYTYGLSGFDTELGSFDDGTGVVGIHGTDDPTSLGSDVRTGCIGLDNEVISRLVDDIGLPLGTPVEILS